MGEKLKCMSGKPKITETGKSWIGVIVETEPSGILPKEGQGTPPGARCRLVEIGPDGTKGKIVFVSLSKEGKG